MVELLDNKLVEKLREIVTNEDLFCKDPIRKESWSLITATMDRLDSSVDYINNHQVYSKDKNNIILFMVHCSIIKDAIYQISNYLKIDYSNDENIFYKYAKDFNYFNNIDDYIIYGDNKNHGDDKFFEYIRSLLFAHPAETTWSIPNRIEGEIQYSPYIISENFNFHNDYKNTFGIEIYSNKRDISYLYIGFDDLKNYIMFKYNKIEKIIDKYNSIVKDFKDEKKLHKVNRNQNEIEILKDIVQILDERYLEHYNIDRLIDYLDCDLTVEKNKKNVEIFRTKIKKIIPKLCDAIDNYKCDEIYSLCYNLLYLTPKGHQLMHYQLEKIFSYLNDDDYLNDDVDWGLKQAENFSKEFAKTWVIIKPYDMSFKEIKLLTRVACYMEYMTQNCKKSE